MAVAFLSLCSGVVNLQVSSFVLLLRYKLSFQTRHKFRKTNVKAISAEKLFLPDIKKISSE